MVLGVLVIDRPPVGDLPVDDTRWLSGLGTVTSECQRWHSAVEERRRAVLQSSVTEAVSAAVAAANAASDTRWAAEVGVGCWAEVEAEGGG